MPSACKLEEKFDEIYEWITEIENIYQNTAQKLELLRIKITKMDEKNGKKNNLKEFLFLVDGDLFFRLFF